MLKRTVLKVEILYDDDDLDFPQNMGLEDIAECIKYGPASSGMVEIEIDEEVSRERMAELLEAQGSDASFLLGEEDEDEDK
jgi:hypothetical protein